MGRLQGWKIGAVLGLIYGIFGWWINYPMIFESPLMLVIGPLFFVTMLLHPLVSLVTDPSEFNFILLPMSGLLLGIIAGKGIEVVVRKMPDIDPWKKGMIIGFFISFLGALCFAESPFVGIFLIGPLLYLTAALLKVISPALDMGSNLPAFLFAVIVVSSVSGSVVGYILGWERCKPDKPEDTVRRQWVKRIAVATACIVFVAALLLVSGFIQPEKMLAPHYSTSFGRMTVLAEFPDSPETMTLYRVAGSDNGSVKFPVRSVEVMSASAAFEHLKNGDFQGPRFKCFCDFILENVSTGYYQAGTGENQTYLEPAWVFRGTLSDGMPWEYYVYARKDYGDLQDSVYTP